MTLTQAASFSKKAFLGLMGLIVFGIIIFVGYHIYYYNYYLPRQPKLEEQPELKYGVLPKPLFGQSVVSSPNLQYALNTETGSVPTDFPKLIKVYFVPQLGTTLLAPDHVRELANNLSFSNGPDIVNQTDYRFNDSQSGVLSIDLTTANFQLVRPDPQNDVENSNLNFENSTELTTAFQKFLSDKHLLTDDLRNGPTKVIYNGQTPADSTQATISIWPSKIDDLTIVTPKSDVSLVNATISKFQDSPEHYLKLNYTIWPTDSTNSSTYPLKPGDQAFEDLKSGNASIVKAPSSPNISITKVELAYFESDQYLPYIEPVYLFEGDNFLAYVPAISSEFLAK